MRNFGFVFLALFFCSCVQAQEWNVAVKKAQQAARNATKTLGEKGPYQLAREQAERLDALDQVFAKQKQAWLHKTHPCKIEWPRDKSARADLSNGWAICSNQMRLAQRIWLQKLANDMTKNKAALLKNLRQLPVGSAQDWARLIPEDRKIIFLGEYHNKNIQRPVEQLLKAYRRQHPQTPMIVLTEFLLDSYPYLLTATGEPHWYLRYFKEFLASQDIMFAGLEEGSCVLDDTFSPAGPVGNSAAGLAARNAHWVRRIEQWRKAYPDAVIFVYAGGGHVGYEYPGSISQNFKDGFVMSFVPLPARHAPELFFASELFHAFTRGQFFKQGVLWYQDPRLARLAGFDVQILLRPEHLQ